MSAIEDVVISLERKIGVLLQKFEVLKLTNAKLSEELQWYKQKNTQQQEQIKSWVEKYETLKIANSLLGSNKNKKETKLKINALIKEIDSCILQLSR